MKFFGTKYSVEKIEVHNLLNLGKLWYLTAVQLKIKLDEDLFT